MLAGGDYADKLHRRRDRFRENRVPAAGPPMDEGRNVLYHNLLIHPEHRPASFEVPPAGLTE